MAITFRYINIQRDDGTLMSAPFIPVYIRADSGRLIRVVALVDSGADTTVVPKDLAIILGIKESSKAFDTGGIGGKVKVKHSRMSLKIKGYHERYTVNIPVLVLQNENADVPLLLGRNGFFESFDVLFRQAAQKITLKKVASVL